MKSNIIDVDKGMKVSGEEYALDELLNIVNTASAHKDSFVKLFEENEDEYLATFSWQSSNKWKVDFPVELHKIHSQRYVTKQQCLKVIRKVYETKTIDGFKNFINVPVHHFTLDEMLEFKKEDEMLLRSQDPL